MKQQMISLVLFVSLVLTVSLFSQTPGTQKWAFDTGNEYTGTISSSPAIGSDGTIYVGSHDNKLYAISPNGTKKWSFTTNDDVCSSPAIGSDGTIYFGSNDNKLYAISPDGTKKWSFTTNDDVRSSPAIGGDGSIYVGSDDNNLYALNPDGTQKWLFTTNDAVFGPPAIGQDGTIYVGGGYYDNNVYALNPDGTEKWIFHTGGEIACSPVIGIDSTIYIGSGDGKLYALNPNATRKWVFTTGGYIGSSPAFGIDGTIYFGSDDKKVYALNPDGTQKWTFTTGDWIGSSPAIGADGIIYIGSDDNKLYALNSDGKKKWSFNASNNIISSPAIGADGAIFVLSDDYNFYAIYSTSFGLANSPWPKFHQNNQNTGVLLLPILASELNYEIISPGMIYEKFIKVYNPLPHQIILNHCSFDKPYFSLETNLPIALPAFSVDSLTVKIQPDSTALYQCLCEVTYTEIGQTKSIFKKLEAGLFLDDASELAYTAHRALAAYDSCCARDVNSIATTNNLGVIYRLLGETVIAEQNLMSALSKGLNAKYGYTGIKMNMGVIKSDQGQATKANDYYAIALKDVAATASQSALAPQLYYNQAWEAYIGDQLAEALTQVDKTIAHSQVNDFLKAKAYVLRGAILYRQGNRDGAKSDFRQAIVLDPDGPIGRMAQWNLQQTDVKNRDDGERVPRLFVLLPNFPNPFNPETTISFGIPQNCKVELVIYNVLGQRVRRLFSGQYEAGWHNVSWDGTDELGRPVDSGVYLLHLQTAGFESMRKMTLLR